MVASEQTLVTGKQTGCAQHNTIRTLAIDAVQQANSGHPWRSDGLAPVAYCFVAGILRYDPRSHLAQSRPLVSLTTRLDAALCDASSGGGESGRG